MAELLRRDRNILSVSKARREVTDLVSLDASKMDNKWKRRKKELGRRARSVAVD